MIRKRKIILILTCTVLALQCNKKEQESTAIVKSNNSTNKLVPKEEIIRKFVKKISLPEPPQIWKIGEKTSLGKILLPNNIKFKYSVPRHDSPVQEYKFANEAYYVIINKKKGNLLEYMANRYRSERRTLDSFNFLKVMDTKFRAYYTEGLSRGYPGKYFSLFIEKGNENNYFEITVFLQGNPPYTEANIKIAKQILGSVKLD